MKKTRLPIQTLLLWEGCAVLGCGILLLFVFLFVEPFAPFWIFQLITFSTLYLITALLYLPLFFKSFSCGVADDSIFLSSGVLFRRNGVLLRRHLVVVGVVQTPLDRLLGIASLRCGAPGAVLTLPLLSVEDARLFRLKLLGGDEE